MDALNDPGNHVVLYQYHTTDIVYTKEATPSGKGSAQNFTRTWKALEGYSAQRYERILDDGSPRPLPM